MCQISSARNSSLVKRFEADRSPSVTAERKQSRLAGWVQAYSDERCSLHEIPVNFRNEVCLHITREEASYA